MFKLLPFVAKNYKLVNRFSTSVRASAFKKYEQDEEYFKKIVNLKRSNNNNNDENTNSLLKVKTDEQKQSNEGKMPLLNDRKMRKTYSRKPKLNDKEPEENPEKMQRFTKTEKQNYHMAKSNELEFGMKKIYETLVKKKNDDFKKFDPGYEVLKSKRNFENSSDKSKSRNENSYSKSSEEARRSGGSQRGDMRFSNNQYEQYNPNESESRSNYNQQNEMRSSVDKNKKRNYVRRDNFKNNKNEVRKTPYEKGVLERNKREAEEKMFVDEQENLSSNSTKINNTKDDYKTLYEYDTKSKVFKDIVVKKFDRENENNLASLENVPAVFKEPESDSIEEQIKSMKPAYRPFAYTLAYFVNESIVLQKFIEMGIEIQHWDEDREICEFILKLNFQRDVEPYLIFLHDLGLKIENSAFVILKNPFFLKEKLDSLQTRIRYFESKGFTREKIVAILSKAPKWLTVSTEDMEKSMNWYRKEFNLDDIELVNILMEQPKLCIIRTKLASDMKFCFKEILGYSDDRIKSMIKSCPKLFTKEHEKIKNNYYYLTDVMKTKDSNISECPQILFMPLVKLRSRFSFLKHLKRNQFDPTKPNFVSLRDICNDKMNEEIFCKKVAKSTIEEYTNFLKSI